MLLIDWLQSERLSPLQQPTTKSTNLTVSISANYEEKKSLKRKISSPLNHFYPLPFSDTLTPMGPAVAVSTVIYLGAFFAIFILLFVPLEE
jgi:hypothetical protein